MVIEYRMRARHSTSSRSQGWPEIKVLPRLCLFFVLLAGGCFYIGKDRIDDILERPSAGWSSRDGLTILMEVMANNLFDQYSPVVKVIATPYYPAVIAATNRAEQRTGHLSESDFRMNMDQQLWEDLGLYVDWRIHRLVDARGYYFKTILQVDSLTFLISISNTSWPCVSPIVVSPTGIFPLFSSNDFPCYTPDISHLEDNIYLVNDRDDSLKASSVWGRRLNTLKTEETVLVKFQLNGSDRHFLDGTESIYLLIMGFDSPPIPIKLKFSVAMMKIAFRQF
jgi:hypothetical protein